MKNLRWLNNQFSLPHLYISLWKVGRMYFLNLGVKRLILVDITGGCFVAREGLMVYPGPIGFVNNPPRGKNRAAKPFGGLFGKPLEPGYSWLDCFLVRRFQFDCGDVTTLREPQLCHDDHCAVAVARHQYHRQPPGHADLWTLASWRRLVPALSLVSLSGRAPLVPPWSWGWASIRAISLWVSLIADCLPISPSHYRSVPSLIRLLRAISMWVVPISDYLPIHYQSVPSLIRLVSGCIHVSNPHCRLLADLFPCKYRSEDPTDMSVLLYYLVSARLNTENGIGILPLFSRGLGIFLVFMRAYPCMPTCVALFALFCFSTFSSRTPRGKRRISFCQ